MTDKEIPSYIDAADVIGAQLLRKRKSKEGLTFGEAQMVLSLAQMEAQAEAAGALTQIADHLATITASLSALAWNLAPEEVRREATRQAQAAGHQGDPPAAADPSNDDMAAWKATARDADPYATEGEA